MQGKIDLSKPLEIAPDVYWIGYVVPDDPFQCHVYLIKNGKESILIDPGSRIVLPVVLEKLTSLVPLSHIKYIIFHHQDPDITGSYEILETLFPPGHERYIVTHWRAFTLLKHYAWKTPFYLIDEHEWKLVAGDRTLEFIFTPYAHFPGAFVTYDSETGVLFSSDIFGSISDKFMLFAEDTREYYEGVELFHKHYMPSSVVLNYAIDRIMEKQPRIIAPQHGSIIMGSMIDKIVKRLRSLDCGLYLIDDRYTDLFLLAKIDAILKEILESVVSSYDFSSLMEKLYEVISKFMPYIKGWTICGKVFGEDICFNVGGSYVVEKVESPYIEEGRTIIRPLRLNGREVGTIYVVYDREVDKDDRKFFDALFKHVESPLAINLHREMEMTKLIEEKEEFEKKSEIDALTGLYNKEYLMVQGERVIDEYGRHHPISVMFLDIDHFKDINDKYGHLTGDKVLREIGALLKTHVRHTDVVGRFGGEEFVIIMPFADIYSACKKAKHLKKLIEDYPFYADDGSPLNVTVSIGVVQHYPRSGETFTTLIERADAAMYRAKRAGRNRVVCS